ncbi:hypothetical protein LTR10_005098 [Elasticomyces elasticus]|nr:hypothetical protein LTR10_005098 [Elasticomyces elasticus]
MEAISDPKAAVSSKPPQRLTKTGILDGNGVEHKLDMMVAAIGMISHTCLAFQKACERELGYRLLVKPSNAMSPPPYMDGYAAPIRAASEVETSQRY